jgi:hypothetical protein
MKSTVLLSSLSSSLFSLSLSSLSPPLLSLLLSTLSLSIYLPSAWLSTFLTTGAWFDPSNPVVPMSGSLRDDLLAWLAEEEESCDLVSAIPAPFVLIILSQ